jgi:hypothetical protein
MKRTEVIMNFVEEEMKSKVNDIHEKSSLNGMDEKGNVMKHILD